MRLGDLDALKEKVALMWGDNNHITESIYEIIDNAPTVDCSNELSEMTFSHALTTEERQDLTRAFLIGKRAAKRPQGEWITKNAKEPCGTDESHETIYRLVPRPHCNKCNIPQIRKTYFCPNCGAEMRKGGKEE